MTVEFKTYLNDIERFFVVVRSSGFVLSAKDCEKVRQWYVRGIPLRIVLEGIIEGHKKFHYHAAPGQRPPHNLSYYGHAIGAKVRGFRKAPQIEKPEATRNQGSEAEILEALSHFQAEGRLSAQTEDRPLEQELKTQLADSLEQLVNRAKNEPLDRQNAAHELRQLDDQIVSLYHSRLEEERLGELMRRAQAQIPGVAHMSTRAREGRTKVLLKSILREELGILEMVS